MVLFSFLFFQANIKYLVLDLMGKEKEKKGVEGGEKEKKHH